MTLIPERFYFFPGSFSTFFCVLRSKKTNRKGAKNSQRRKASSALIFGCCTFLVPCSLFLVPCSLFLLPVFRLPLLTFALYPVVKQQIVSHEKKTFTFRSLPEKKQCRDQRTVQTGE